MTQTSDQRTAGPFAVAAERNARNDLAALRPRLRRESLVFAAIFSLALFGLSLVLIAWRTEQLLTQLSQDRVVRLMHQVASEAERAMQFGVAVADQPALAERLQRLQTEDDSVRAVFVDTARGEAVASAGDEALRAGIDPRWNTAVLSSGPEHPPSVRTTARAVYAGTAMFDSTGSPAATLWAAVDPSEVRAQAQGAALVMVLRALPLIGLTLLVTWWALLRWSTRVMGSVQPDRSGLRQAGYGKALWVALVLALVAAPFSMVWIAREAARPFVTQQIESNADAVGRALAGQVARAMAAGVPWEGLSGVDELFDKHLAEAPELSYLALLRGDAPATHATWGTQDAGPLHGAAIHSGSGGGGTAGGSNSESDGVSLRSISVAETGSRVVVGYPANFVSRQLSGMVLDLILALVVAAVLVRELSRGLWRKSLLHPLAAYAQARAWQHVQRRWQRRHTVAQDVAAAHERDAAECRAQLLEATGHREGAQASSAALPAGVAAQLTLLRLAVFLVALSEELLRPFFTVFASEVRPFDMALSPTMLAGLPVAAFMTTLALAQPLGPALAKRFDLRWSLVFAALAGMCALAATALAKDAWTLIVLRATGGAAYGLALILVQTAIVRITPPRQRARGLAEVAAAIVAAGIVGPPFGGLIAARAGDVAGFVACALCMATALVVALRLSLQEAMGTGAAAQRGLATTGGWRGYVAVLREPRAVCVILGAALPARLVAVTVLAVVVPLYMSALNQQPAVAGRVLLLYFLCFASTATLVAHWSDLLGQRKPFIVWGGVLSVAACLSLPLLGGVWGMAACCALLGFGQALQSSPQIALTTEFFEHPADRATSATPEQALAAFRLIERGGSIVAPFVTAVAVTAFGYAGAVVAVGALLTLATGGLAAGLRAPRAGGVAA
ncbi:MFS transporter [Paracidovorax sp. MALMAid1276]|uniref:MFS transporter n=1 Tax=Paracidovorax sp. MALMAid1276 TaxID=3411631 RepID=UPI003B9D7F53